MEASQARDVHRLIRVVRRSSTTRSETPTHEYPMEKAKVMKQIRRIAAILLASACIAPLAQAQIYPDKTIRLVVPWPAGGGADAVGRAVAQALTTELGKTVYVDNVAGAGGNIGTQQFIRAAPDGYTLLLATSSTNAANPHLYKRTGFDPINDFTPIASVALIPSVLIVPSTSKFKSPA